MPATKRNSVNSRVTKTFSKKNKARLAAISRWSTNLVLQNDSTIIPEYSDLPKSKIEEPTGSPLGLIQQPSTSSDSYVHQSRPNENIVSTEFKTRLSDLEKSLNVLENDRPIDMNRNECVQYGIVDFGCLNNLIENLACPKCKQLTLSTKVSHRFGLASKVEVECSSCDIISDFYTSKKIVDTNTFDVNYRMVSHFISNGQGYSAMEKLGIVLNMEIMSNSTFSKMTKSLSKSTIKSGQINLTSARERVRQTYAELDKYNNDYDKPIDIAVSFDGTWHKRGHTSNYGVGCVIELHTGLVIDYCVLSKYCHACALAMSDLGKDSPEFDIWFSGHKSECNINYTGSSPAMETEAAERLWKSSLDYNFRYTTILSDGDSKSWQHIQSLNVYGDSTTINKEECINHVSKRLGTALRKVVKDCRVKKITLGGIAYGSLKDATIIKLQKYYKNAILKNKDNVDGMKSSILATLHHCVSTDENPRHFKCPTGTESWCFYNRALANGKTPGPHKKNLKTPITETVLKHIAPVYQRLGSYELLNRCSKCLTQNSNESLNGLIWTKCPKVRNVSKRAVETAVAAAVGEYNFGNTAVTTFMTTAGMKIGRKSTLLMRRRDKRRIRQAKMKKTKYFQEYRRKVRMIKHYREEKLKEKEGLTYGPGEF